MHISLEAIMRDYKEWQRKKAAMNGAIERYTEERMNDEYGRIHTDGSRSGGQPVLFPCPFCGAQPHHGLSKVMHDGLHGDPYQRFLVWCPKDHAKVDKINREQAFAAWNTRQPTQSDALQADALDFGNELIFACAGLRHEPIDTQAIFSITWDGFPYDVTICAAKGQSK